jgi:hypothetical protein
MTLLACEEQNKAQAEEGLNKLLALLSSFTGA